MKFILNDNADDKISTSVNIIHNNVFWKGNLLYSKGYAICCTMYFSKINLFYVMYDRTKITGATL